VKGIIVGVFLILAI